MLSAPEEKRKEDINTKKKEKDKAEFPREGGV